MATEGPERPRVGWAVPAGLVGLGLAAWWFVLGLELTGVDTWPLLHQARRALEDPSVLWTERYLEGVWSGGVFWRPVLVAAFALQSLLFGDAPAGYHALRLAGYLVVALCAGSLAARRGASPRLAFGLAGALVLLHPLQVEMVPSVARSANVLADLALAGCLVLLAPGGAGRLRLSCGVALGLLAPGINEAGLIAPVLGLLLLAPWRAGAPGRRLAAGVLLLGELLHVGARFALLGTLGRYAEERGEGVLEKALTLARGLGQSGEAGLLVAVGVLLGASLLLAPRGTPAGVPADEAWGRVRLACWGWIFAGVAGQLLAPRVVERHAAYELVPLAVLLAAHLAGGVSALRGGGLRPAASLLLAAVALGLVCVPRSPLWRRYPQWPVVGETSAAITAAAERAARAARADAAPARAEVGPYHVLAFPPAGGAPLRIVLNPLPFSAAPAPPGARNADLLHPVILKDYSVRAFLLDRGLGPVVVEVVGRRSPAAGDLVPVR